MDRDTRRRVTSAGGKARAANMTPDERRRLSQAGAAAIHSLPGLVRRAAAKWDSSTDEERAQARAIMADLLARP